MREAAPEGGRLNNLNNDNLGGMGAVLGTVQFGKGGP